MSLPTTGRSDRMGAVFRQLSSPHPHAALGPRASRPFERLCPPVRWRGRHQGPLWPDPRLRAALASGAHSLGSLPLGPLEKPRKHPPPPQKLLWAAHRPGRISIPNPRTRAKRRGPASGQRADESQTCLRRRGPAICIPPPPVPPLGVNLQAKISLFD